MSSYNVYIGGKADFGDGSKWNLLYLPNQNYSNRFPLEFVHNVGSAFVLSESQAKKWSDDFAAWFVLTACSGLYVGEPENGDLMKILLNLTEFEIGACYRACEATSADGRFMCSLKAVFECDTVGCDQSLGRTTSYRYNQSGVLVEFRVAVEKGGPLEDPRRVLFDEWPSD